MLNSFNKDGLLYCILVALLVSLVIFVGPVIKKAYPKWKQITNCWFFWMPIGVVCLTYLLALRYIPGWIDGAAQIKQVGGVIALDDWWKSKIFLTDICPLSNIILLILIIADPSRKLARSMAPIAIIGGIMTFISYCSNPFITFNFKCMFYEDASGNRCNILYHFLNIFLGVCMMINTPKGGIRSWIISLAMIVGIYIYYAILLNALHMNKYVSGLIPADWAEGGAYYNANKILKIPPEIAPYICLPIFGLIGTGIILLKECVFCRGMWAYGNVKSKKWYFWWDWSKFDETKDRGLIKWIKDKKNEKKNKNKKIETYELSY